MLYLPFIVIILVGLCFFLYRKHKIELLKRYGIKTKGIIVHNDEENRYSFYRLGGNFYSPTMQFETKDGKEIIGKPVIGFTSQNEIEMESEFDIIYDPENPEDFCIDLE